VALYDSGRFLQRKKIETYIQEKANSSGAFDKGAAVERISVPTAHRERLPLRYTSLVPGESSEQTLAYETLRANFSVRHRNGSLLRWDIWVRIARNMLLEGHKHAQIEPWIRLSWDALGSCSCFDELPVNFLP